MKLYEINEMLKDAFDEIDKYAEEHEGVLDHSYIELLDLINLAKDEKLLNVAKYVKGIEAEADAFDIEIEKLKKRKTALNNKADSLRNYILMNADKGKKIEDPTTIISWRKSEFVNVLDEKLLPEDFIKTKIEKSPDKILIKEALKSGLTVPGAEIKENMNLQIK